MTRRTHFDADRRARFVQEYAKDLNATQAAIRAGYSTRTAKGQASRLLSNRRIRSQVDALLAEVTRSNKITVERTLKEIARLAYSDIRKLYDAHGSLRPMHELDDDAAALLAGVETEELFAGSGGDRVHIGYTRKVKTWSKTKALDLCMAYLGMHKTTNPTENGSMKLTINLSGRSPS